MRDDRDQWQEDPKSRRLWIDEGDGDGDPVLWLERLCGVLLACFVLVAVLAFCMWRANV